MTEITLKHKKWSKYPWNLKYELNSPKPKNWLKYPYNLKKKTEIPPKPENYQNTSKT